MGWAGEVSYLSTSPSHVPLVLTNLWIVLHRSVFLGIACTKIKFVENAGVLLRHDAALEHPPNRFTDPCPRVLLSRVQF